MSPVRIRDHRPASLAFELLALVGGVERPDRLRRTIESGIIGGHANVREHTGDRPVGERGVELRDDQRTDLRLRLRNGQPQRQSRCLVCRALLAQQLVADLRPVAVRDHQCALVEQRLQG